MCDLCLFKDTILDFHLLSYGWMTVIMADHVVARNTGSSRYVGRMSLVGRVQDAGTLRVSGKGVSDAVPRLCVTVTIWLLLL